MEFGKSLIMLGPSKSYTDIVVFEADLNCLGNDLEWFMDEDEYILDLTELNPDEFIKECNNYKNIIDFFGIGKKKIEFNIFKLQVPSQSTLSYLKDFIPNEKFVSYKRWGNSEESYFDEAYMTSLENSSHNSDIKIEDLPNCENFDEDAVYNYDYYQPDELRIFRYNDFKNMIKNYKGGMLDLNFK